MGAKTQLLLKQWKYHKNCFQITSFTACILCPNSVHICTQNLLFCCCYAQLHMNSTQDKQEVIKATIYSRHYKQDNNSYESSFQRTLPFFGHFFHLVSYFVFKMYLFSDNKKPTKNNSTVSVTLLDFYLNWKPRILS